MISSSIAFAPSNLVRSLLKDVPEELEAQISAKRFSHAVEILNDAIGTANQDALLEISALGDLRQYLKSQAVSLVEILVEELHNHLYLKSPYCDGRWAAYNVGQADLPVIRMEDFMGEEAERRTRTFSSTGQLELEIHQDRMADTESILEGQDDQHPESDSLRYIVVLTQALYSMGKLPYALEVMSQRLPVEVSQMVSRTTAEVGNRHRSTKTQTVVSTTKSLTPDAIEEDTEPLRDLLWTLFSKWDAVLQAHRALYDAVGHLQDRRFADKRSSLHGASVAYDFADVWHPLESELKKLLNNHLSEGEKHIHAKQKENVLNDLFASRTARTKRVGLFTIAKATTRSDQPFVLEEQELRDMLQGSVPGLLSENNENIPKSTTMPDELADFVCLARPSPFNISALLDPTLAFLKRAKRIVPHTATLGPSTISDFLDEFLENVFYTQLIGSVDDLYRNTVEGSTDRSRGSSYDTRHIHQTTKNLLEMISQLIYVLSTIPYHREVYSQAVLGVIANYYQKCASWLSILTANPKPSAHLGALRLGAAWASRQPLRNLWQTYDIEAASELQLYESVSTEIGMLLEAKKDFVIRPEDLLQDPAAIEGLVSLYQSVSLFGITLSDLHPLAAAGSALRLEMTPEARRAYETLLKSYQTLGRSILLALRIEIRTHVFYHLQLALGQGNYNIEEKANEVDSTIADLNTDLQAICTPLAKLSQAEYKFLMSGLATLINEVFIEDSVSITIMTKHGAEKLVLDISALQQNLRNLVSDPAEADLSRASKFYSQFQLGPSGLSEQASTTSLDFTFSQASKLMALMYSADLNKNLSKTNNRDSISNKRKQLNDHLALLSSRMATNT